ncbi:MAG: hypothetical protein JNG89_11630, partial [Planctomycetaceae bacterium]|nr:hypothetical protein [Planctomycetaceae bacterium]
MHETRPADASAPRPVDVSTEAPLRDPGEALAPLLDDFQAAIDLRVARERQLAAEQAEREDEPERDLRAQLAAVDAAHANDSATLEAEYQARRETTLGGVESEASAAHEHHLSRVREIEARYYRETADVEARHEDSSWVTSSVLDDEAEDSPLRQYERATQARERTRDQQLADMALVEAELYGDSDEQEPREPVVSALESPPRTLDDAQQMFSMQIDEARACLAASAALKLPRLFRGYSWLVLFLAIFAATSAPLYLFVPGGLLGFTDGAAWGAVSAGAGAVVGLLLLGLLYAIGAHQQSDLRQQAVEAHGTANALHQVWRDLAARDLQKVQAEFDARQANFTSQRQLALERFQRAHDERRAELEQTRTQDLQTENRRYAEQQQALRAESAELTVGIDAKYGEQRQALIASADSRRSSLQAQLDDHVQKRRRRQAELWHQLKSEWDAATRQLELELQQAQAASRSLFRDWSELAGGGWTPATELPPGIRRGQYDVNLDNWPNAIPADMRLAPRVTHFAVPSITPFPDGASLLLRTPTSAARAMSAQMLQSLLLRWLTLVPPGKLRLTILDPVGLGESFAGFMHLADFDELLVTTRIWTEPDQIEQQLADLTQ